MQATEAPRTRAAAATARGVEVPLKQGGVVVLGNEGTGVSEAVLPFVTGAVTIAPWPTLADKTPSSLNVAVAAGIVLDRLRHPR